jgi:putative tryptophan/tyrosine transport system substrate-binding protein
MRMLRSRRDFLRGLGAVGAGVALEASGASPAGAKRLGVFRWEKVRFEGLVERGWREGQNLEIVWREINVERPGLEQAAAELVATRPHAVFTESTPATHALAKATATIPIVTSVGDPLRSGFARSLARPGGNITGLCNLTPGAEIKTLEMLRALAPRLGRVMLLFGPAQHGSGEFVQRYTEAAGSLAMQAHVFRLSSPTEAQKAVREGITAGAQAAVVVILDDPTLDWLAHALPQNRIPTLCAKGQVDERFLVSVEHYHANVDRSLSAIIDKVLRGENPGEIAFEQPDAAHIVLNRRIAKAMKVAVPAEISLIATRVVD